MAGIRHVGGHQCPITLEAVEVPVEVPDGGRQVVAVGTLDRRGAGIKAPSFLIRRTVQVEVTAVLRAR